MRRYILEAMLVLAACGSPEAAAGPAAGPAKAVEVGVVTLAATDVALTRELPGRVTARRTAEVRARVNGIVEARLFTEGSDVKAGDPLFRIESAPYDASLAAARANLARSEASLALARQTAERSEALLQSNTLSREEAEAAEASLRAAQAEAAANRAAVKTARINRQYTVVAAPVSGRIGRSEVTEGAYVQQASATRMATIQQIDSVYVDIAQSAAELLRLRRDLASHRLERGDAAVQVRLVLDDGSLYPEPGVLQFADVTVDAQTGSVTLRALFPNPRGELLPGMFVRARVDEGVLPQALLVPQRALTRDPRGQAVVLVVDAAGKVERRTVVADRAVGDAWLVREGLAPGDPVIVEGLQKIRPGAAVVAVPATEAKPANPGAAAAAAVPTAAAPAGPQK
jgi:membrane fusion protein, multidrug efflux system